MAELEQIPEQAKAEKLLIDFLQADLDLAFTWLRTADIDSHYHPEGCEAALEKVRAALETICRLQVRITGAEAREKIRILTEELESALKSRSAL